MNHLIAKNIMGFMGRVQLQGVEVPAYHEAMCALHEIANHKASAGDEKTKSIQYGDERSVKVDGVDVPLTEDGTQSNNGEAGIITENSDGSVSIVGLRV